VRLGGRPNALAIIYRNVWTLVTSDAEIFTPVPERYLPGSRDGSILDLYNELRNLDVMKIQRILI